MPCKQQDILLTINRSSKIRLHLFVSFFVGNLKLYQFTPKLVFAARKSLFVKCISHCGVGCKNQRFRKQCLRYCNVLGGVIS